jgi:hypothetical protein
MIVSEARREQLEAEAAERQAKKGVLSNSTEVGSTVEKLATEADVSDHKTRQAIDVARFRTENEREAVTAGTMGKSNERAFESRRLITLRTEQVRRIIDRKLGRNGAIWDRVRQCHCHRPASAAKGSNAPVGYTECQPADRRDWPTAAVPSGRAVR